jgi:hypothetical protein
MRKLIRATTAANILLGIYGLLGIFHLLVLARVVPSDIVWGGRMGNAPADPITLETIALAVTALFGVITAAKVDYIKVGNLKQAVGILVWLVFVYSLLNIAGNLASGSPVEKAVFTPVSVAVAVLLFRLAMEK